MAIDQPGLVLARQCKTGIRHIVRLARGQLGNANQNGSVVTEQGARSTRLVAAVERGEEFLEIAGGDRRPHEACERAVSIRDAERDVEDFVRRAGRRDERPRHHDWQIGCFQKLEVFAVSDAEVGDRKHQTAGMRLSLRVVDPDGMNLRKLSGRLSQILVERLRLADLVPAHAADASHGVAGDDLMRLENRQGVLMHQVAVTRSLGANLVPYPLIVTPDGNRKHHQWQYDDHHDGETGGKPMAR